MWQSIKISVLFHKSTHQALPFWLEKNFWKVSQFSRKTYIVCKIWTKMVLVRIWSVTPWLSDSQSKFQSYSTNLHLQHYHSDNKEFLESFPIFQKNLHCLPNRYKIDSQFHIHFHIQFHIQRLLQDYLLLFGNFTPIPQICTHRATNLAKNIFEQISQFSRSANFILKSYPLILWQLIKISVLFYKSTHQTLPIWLKRNFGKFLNFPKKLTLCTKFEQKWFCWDSWFWSLTPMILWQSITISVLFHKSTHRKHYHSFTEKNFWKVSQFSRKTYIVCKIWTKMVLVRIWSVTPWLSDSQSKFQSYSTNLHLQHYHSDNKEFLESFHKSYHCLPKQDTQFHITLFAIFYKIICCKISHNSTNSTHTQFHIV